MDESVRSRPTHQPATGKGEETAQEGGGRVETGRTQTGRPTGKSTARDFTGINADMERPIDPNSPMLTPS